MPPTRSTPGAAAGPAGFDPARLPLGDPVAVDAEALAAHPAVRRDERDPRHGGRCVPPFDFALEDLAPGHGLTTRYGHLTRAETLARRDTGEAYQSVDAEMYFAAIERSMRTRGQLRPGILRRLPDGRWWLAEGNHRLAVARRARLPFQVVRAD